MRFVIPGGTGQVGTILDRALTAAGHDVVVLTRTPRHERQVRWDGETLGAWADHIDGSDVVINLAGRSVSCRYTDENLKAMMDSRVRSASVVGGRDRRRESSARVVAADEHRDDLRAPLRRRQRRAHRHHRRHRAGRARLLGLQRRDRPQLGRRPGASRKHPTRARWRCGRRWS